MNDKQYKLNYQRPIRILHVVGAMNRCGTETWLMHVLRNVDRHQFQMDFLVHTKEPGAYDDEICALGSQIIPCLDRFNLKIYAKNFKNILNEYGPYDIVHSHVHYFSGIVLRIAKQANIPICISHSHNDTSSIENKTGWKRRAYIALMSWWIERYSTLGLAASCDAASDLFGFRWQTDSRWKILYCGIDLAPFYEKVNLFDVRAELNIPADAFVIGHVGRFESQKNHRFLLEIAAEIAKKEPMMRLLLIGDGQLRSEIENELNKLNLIDRVILTGVRSDVARLMLGAMDLFVFPSLYEGLGLVLIEAQAAGLPCIISDVVPKEADVIKPLVKRLSLSKKASQWAEYILDYRHETPLITSSDALELVENSPFNIQTSWRQLENIYRAEFFKK